MREAKTCNDMHIHRGWRADARVAHGRAWSCMDALGLAWSRMDAHWMRMDARGYACMNMARLGAHGGGWWRLVHGTLKHPPEGSSKR